MSSDRQGGDRCPDVTRLHQSADGLLGRVSIPTSVLPLTAARQFVAAIESIGGVVELTGRANLQVRRLDIDSVPQFHEAVTTLREHVPFAGASAQLVVVPWPDDHVTVDDLVEAGAALAAALSAAVSRATEDSNAVGDPRDSAGTPGVFRRSQKLKSVVLTASIYRALFDDSLKGTDLALGLTHDALWIGVSGVGWTWSTARSQLGLATASQVITEAIDHFEQLRLDIAGGLFGHGQDAARMWHPTDLPADVRHIWLTDLDARCRATGMTRLTLDTPPRQMVIPPLGPVANGVWLHVRPKNRFLTGEALEETLGFGESGLGDGQLALLPWAAVLLPQTVAGTPTSHGSTTASKAAGHGLQKNLPSWHTDPDDAEGRITACTGQPGCASALVDVHQHISTLSRVTATSDLPVRLSACDRTCGKPTGRHLSIIAGKTSWSAEVTAAGGAAESSATDPVLHIAVRETLAAVGETPATVRETPGR